MEEARREIQLRKVKLLGGIGMLLLFLNLGVGWIAGLVLLFIALKTLAEETQRKSIFYDYLTGFVFVFVFNIIATILAFVSFWGIFGAFTEPPYGRSAQVLGAAGFILPVIIGIIISIMGYHYIRRSFTTIAEVTNERMFATSGQLLFWGAVLTLIFIGVLVSFVGEVLGIVAFFSLPDTLQMEVP